MSRGRRKQSSVFKAKVALEPLKGQEDGGPAGRQV